MASFMNGIVAGLNQDPGSKTPKMPERVYCAPKRRAGPLVIREMQRRIQDLMMQQRKTRPNKVEATSPLRTQYQ